MTKEQYEDLLRRLEQLERHTHNTGPSISVGGPVYPVRKERDL